MHTRVASRSSLLYRLYARRHAQNPAEAPKKPDKCDLWWGAIMLFWGYFKIAGLIAGVIVTICFALVATLLAAVAIFGMIATLVCGAAVTLYLWMVGIYLFDPVIIGVTSAVLLYASRKKLWDCQIAISMRRYLRERLCAEVVLVD